MNEFNIFSITPFDWKAIFTALLTGSIIGLERQLRGKPVGIRTSIIITLGTYIFVVSAFSINNESSDPSRVIGQVITGIGFLGAGVMLARDGLVSGVTSAATIWILASIGVSIAIGYNMTSIKLAVVVVLVLVGVEALEGYFQALTKGVHSKFKNWRNKE